MKRFGISSIHLSTYNKDKSHEINSSKMVGWLLLMMVVFFFFFKYIVQAFSCSDSHISLSPSVSLSPSAARSLSESLRKLIHFPQLAEWKRSP